MKHLVIDASISVGAGGHQHLKPGCKPCRDFLQEVLANGHCVTWTESIALEWRNHAASFSRRWLVQMFGRKRVTRLAVPETPGLLDRILLALATDNQRESAAKDCHLIEAALASDRTVASLDDTVRALFAHACDSAVELQDIVWINPNMGGESPLQWLSEDAPAEPARTLAQFTGK